MGSKKKQLFDARAHMVESQIHPMGVSHEGVLEAFATVPREEFVPGDKCGICYCDEDIEIAKDRYLIEASVMARLIQALLNNTQAPHEKAILIIGSGRGYGAAVCSALVSTVIALEESKSLLNYAQKAWDKTGCNNIVGTHGKLAEGHAKDAPYSMILIEGAVSEIPQNIKEQLKVGGHLVVLRRGEPRELAQAVLVDHIQKGVFSERILFEAGTPYLTGFEPEKEFIF
ncbi:MAG: protein-L-isoaspartate O-methyltransferase [Alphaproteobacteria bacterium]|nr:protein-L-isoaspartate O-methyltransferase [Alphaproteobacteria bacterium]